MEREEIEMMCKGIAILANAIDADFWDVVYDLQKIGTITEQMEKDIVEQMDDSLI